MQEPEQDDPANPANPDEQDRAGQKQAEADGPAEEQGTLGWAEVADQPERQEGTKSAAWTAEGFGSEVDVPDVGQDGRGGDEQGPADEPARPGPAPAADKEHQDQDQPEDQQDVDGQTERVQQGLADPGPGRAEQVAWLITPPPNPLPEAGRGLGGGVVRAGRGIAQHADTEQQPGGQQQASQEIEMPLALLRHEADSGCCCNRGSSIPFGLGP